LLCHAYLKQALAIRGTYIGSDCNGQILASFILVRVAKEGKLADEPLHQKI